MSLARCNSVMKSFQKYDVKIALLSRRNENESLLLPIIQPKARIQIQVHSAHQNKGTTLSMVSYLSLVFKKKPQFLHFFPTIAQKLSTVSYKGGVYIVHYTFPS